MSSYYVPLPAAEMPRNALLDFSPIRQAMMDRRNMENLAYERQRQNMLDQRALDNQAYERGRNALSDKMAEQKFAWETEDRNKPKFMEVGGNLLSIDPKTNQPNIAYSKPDFFQSYFGGSNPTNALSETPNLNNQVVQSEPNFSVPPQPYRGSFNPMTNTFQSRPLNGVVMDQPTQNPIIQPRVSPQSVQSVPSVNRNTPPQQKTIRVGNRDVTEDQAMMLLSHPDAGMRELAKGLMTKFSSMSGAGLEKGNKANLEERTINAQVGWGMLNDIKQKFDPKYLTGSEQLKNYARSWQAYLTGSLSPEAQADYSKYITWRQDTLDYLNASIKAITGASMSVQEADRIIASLPNDKDDPIAYQAKLENAMKKVRQSILKFNYMKQNGLEFAPEELQFKVTDQDLKGFRRRKQLELTQQIASQMNADPKDPAVQEQVKQAIMSEFEGID